MAGSWAYSVDPKVSFFQWLSTRPDDLAAFQDHMKGYTSERGTWFNLYPVQRFLDGFRADTPLIVDVGGSTGHDIEKFCQKYPQSPGKLIIQDLPEVVEKAKELPRDEAISLTGHDFFTPQPVKGK
jgi:hypothetical protein